MKPTPIPLVLALLITALPASEIKERSVKFITSFMGGEVSLDFQKFEIPLKVRKIIRNKVKQKFSRKNVYIWRIQEGNITKGYAVLDNVKGKSMPITFIVLFDEKGKIMASEIIKYREPIGGAVSNRRWHQQFVGRNQTSKFEVGKEIDGISGATISAKSVSKGIEKLAHLIPEVRKHW